MGPDRGAGGAGGGFLTEPPRYAVPMALRERVRGVTGAGRHRVAGLLAGAAAVLVWGATSAFVKEIHGVSGLAISFHRLWIGAALTATLFLLSGGRFSVRLLRLSFAGGVAFA